MKSVYLILVVLALGLSGCTHHREAPAVAEVDIEHLMTQWPQALQTMQQLNRLHNPRERAKRMMHFQATLVERIRHASAVVAARDGLKLVVTRDLVGYGNTDITSEVIAELNHRKRR